ncbi:hypothetical protein ACIGXM_14680 [Kitasatospora sp. NPDC052896]|uniref:hypothetical protein n=1 Tax=Kitasatospora sp. NPDC052896 TaxID=3364061 RepID=UPI0037C82891
MTRTPKDIANQRYDRRYSYLDDTGELRRISESAVKRLAVVAANAPVGHTDGYSWNSAQVRNAEEAGLWTVEWTGPRAWKITELTALGTRVLSDITGQP